MRIIAGRFRRRTLKTNPGHTTRPITDRVKESLFEHLADVIPGAHVADIFAGTGTLGLESLSRGAVHATFIERDRKAVELLRENVAKLEVEDETLVWPADVTKCSFRPKGGAEDTPWNVIFFDPPYRFVQYIKRGTASTPHCKDSQRTRSQRRMLRCSSARLREQSLNCPQSGPKTGA